MTKQYVAPFGQMSGEEVRQQQEEYDRKADRARRLASIDNRRYMTEMYALLERLLAAWKLAPPSESAELTQVLVDVEKLIGGGQ